jgi:hypothetical protein
MEETSNGLIRGIIPTFACGGWKKQRNKYPGQFGRSLGRNLKFRTFGIWSRSVTHSTLTFSPNGANVTRLSPVTEGTTSSWLTEERTCNHITSWKSSYSISHLKTEFLLKNISKLSSYLTGNMRLHYKDHFINTFLREQMLFIVRTIRNTQYTLWAESKVLIHWSMWYI